MPRKSRFKILPNAFNDDVVMEFPSSRSSRKDNRSQINSHGGFNQPNETRYIKNVKPKSDGQAILLETIRKKHITIALGPAGTGKTYLAIAEAVDALKTGKCKRIIISRPAVEAGERLGFLPGDLKDKLDPYMRPIYDALLERISASQLNAWMAEKVIEIAPLAFMRGRTLAGCAIVVDEAQNATYTQLKMVLTRLGFGSFMVITGDPEQIDLKDGESGLKEIAHRLDCDLENIGVVRLDKADIIRHPTVRDLLNLI